MFQPVTDEPPVIGVPVSP